MCNQRGKFQGASAVFHNFVAQLISTRFLLPGHVLICDNSTIHLTDENKKLAEILWEKKKFLILNLPLYTPELNPIELIFQILGHCLSHSNTKHMHCQMKSDNFFLLKCIEFMENVS